MSVFSYTGGALANLVGNTPGANVSNLVTLLNDLKTYLNGGNLDYQNVAAVVQSQYANIKDMQAQNSGLTTGTWVFANGAFVPTTGGAAVTHVFKLDAARFPSGTRTPKLSLEATTLVNATAPTSTYTYGLYPVTAVAGGAAANTITTIGAVVAGSTVALANPGPSSLNNAATTDFSFPATGFYALGMALSSANEVANASVIHRVTLAWRPV